jgi:hypothetical protein
MTRAYEKTSRSNQGQRRILVRTEKGPVEVDEFELPMHAAHSYFLVPRKYLKSFPVAYGED